MPIEDAREIVADSAALVAEIEAIREALESERKATAELIAEMNAYKETAEKERALYAEQTETLKQGVKAERKRAVGLLFVGLAVGFVVGALAN